MKLLLALEAALAVSATLIVVLVFPCATHRWVAMLRDAAANARRQWSADPRAHRAGLTAILALAIGIRLVHLNQPMRYDEAYTYLQYASQPLRIALTDYTLPNNHLFHTLLVWLATHAFGNAPWVIRLPVFLAGVALIPLVYLAARRLATPDAGLFAAALTAALPSLILYSTNARGYMIICVAFILLLLLARSLLDMESPERWLSFAIVIAVGMYTAPVMLYPAGAIVLWLLGETWRAGSRRTALALAPRLTAALILAGILTAMAFAPVVVRSGTSVLMSNRFVAALTWHQFAAATLPFIRSVRGLLGMGIPTWLVAVLALAVLVAVTANRTGRDRLTRLLSISAFWCVVLLAITRHPPPARVFIYLAPLGALYAGIGLAVIAGGITQRMRIRPGVMTAVSSVTLLVAVGASVLRSGVVFRSDETDWIGLKEAPAVAKYLRNALQAQDRLVVVDVGVPIGYYLLRSGGRRLDDYAAPTRTGRLVVVVNTAHEQTLDLVRQRRPEVPWETLAAPTLLLTIGSAGIYEFQPRIRQP